MCKILVTGITLVVVAFPCFDIEHFVLLVEMGLLSTFEVDIALQIVEIVPMTDNKHFLLVLLLFRHIITCLPLLFILRHIILLVLMLLILILHHLLLTLYTSKYFQEITHMHFGSFLLFHFYVWYCNCINLV